jgi:hypothetical protein
MLKYSIITKIVLLSILLYSSTVIAQQNTLKRINALYSANIGANDTILVTSVDSTKLKIEILYNDLANQKEVNIILQDNQNNPILTHNLILNNSPLPASTTTQKFVSVSINGWNPYTYSIILSNSQKYLTKSVKVFTKDISGNLSNPKIYEF